MTTIFNNLLKVVLNIESDSEKLQNIAQTTLNFTPDMLYAFPTNNNAEGILLPYKINMKRLFMNTRVNNTDSTCPEYKDEEELKKNLIRVWDNAAPNNTEEKIKARFRNTYTGGRLDEETAKENVKSNINFLVCLFFKNYECLTHLNGPTDTNIYLIIDKKMRDPDLVVIDYANYERTYEVSLTVTVIDIFKPAYLKMNLNVNSPTKNANNAKINELFLPTMIDDELEPIQDDNNSKMSLYFSPFILLDPTKLKTPLASFENRKIFTDEKLMREWIKKSFYANPNTKIYNWTNTQVNDIPKRNMKLLLQLFLAKDMILTIREKDYEIVKAHTVINDPIYLTTNALSLRLVCSYTANNTITLKETTNNDFIVLDIKIQIDSSLLSVSDKKRKKNTLEFTPKMVNKSITENTIYFIPYLEIPKVSELQKLNGNYMRLFTVPSEFLKLLQYLRQKNKSNKKYDINNDADVDLITAIIEKNMNRMMEIFFPLNGEVFLNREIVLNYLDQAKEEKQFYIIKRGMQYTPDVKALKKVLPTPGSRVFPKKYTMLIELQLATNRFNAVDFYKLGCGSKTAQMDEKWQLVLDSAFHTPQQQSTEKTRFFTELMEADEPPETSSVKKMRPALFSEELKGGKKKGLKHKLTRKRKLTAGKRKTGNRKIKKTRKYF
jgi:hypothetical protein